MVDPSVSATWLPWFIAARAWVVVIVCPRTAFVAALWADDHPHIKGRSALDLAAAPVAIIVSGCRVHV